MKITIIGAGAMGTLFAGLLSKGGNDVYLLTRNKKTEKILKKNGIKISGITKTIIPSSKLKITTNPAEICCPDLVIILVKSYDTISTVPSIKKMAGKNTVVLTLQNGLGNYEILSEFLGKKRIIGGTTSESSTLVKSGDIVHTGKGETIIEEGGFSGQIADIFNRCGIKTVLSDKIESVIWSKLVLNCAINPVAAISGVRNGEIIKYKNLFEVAVEAGKEVVTVAKKMKIKILFPGVAQIIKNICLATSKNTNSMLADILSKRKTEIDSLNGAVVKIAEKLKVPVPVNKSLYRIVKKYDFRN
ncbi:MAG: 2-dehydropantoate 2-reductase [Elusimicrobia bacterium]|nr:2-dehydropantoate 2-reductase [Elusimicrobiota bacterium]